MAVELKVTLIADTPTDVAYALEHAIRKINEGYKSGDLRNDSVFIGSWDISEVCDVCYGDGKVGDKPCKKCKK